MTSNSDNQRDLSIEAEGLVTKFVQSYLGAVIVMPLLLQRAASVWWRRLAFGVLNDRGWRGWRLDYIIYVSVRRQEPEAYDVNSMAYIFNSLDDTTPAKCCSDKTHRLRKTGRKMR